MPNPVTGTLADADYTASDYLRFGSFTLYGKGSRSPHGTEVRLGVDPDLEWLPDVESGIVQTPAGGQKDISIGYEDFLRFKTGKRRGWEGKTTFNQLTGRVGPLEAYYEEKKGKRPFDTKTKTYGGSLTLGPLRLSGEQLRRTVNSVPPEKRKFFTNPESEETRRRMALEASYPLAGIPGLQHLGDRGSRVLKDWHEITAALSRNWGEQKFPHFKGASERYSQSFPHQTTAHIGATFPLGLAELILQAQYERIRGQEPSLRASISGGLKF